MFILYQDERKDQQPIFNNFAQPLLMNTDLLLVLGVGAGGRGFHSRGR